MTDNMQRARERISDMVLEVLACEPCIGTCESEESFAHRIAVAAAMRLAVPEGWVMVPREPTNEMRSLALSHLYGAPFWRADAKPIGTFYSGHTATESEMANIAECGPDRLNAAYRAMLAAAPRHETGEGL